MYLPPIAFKRPVLLNHLAGPLRIVHRPPNPRLFTQNSQLLLISRTTPRPQLPFLYNSSNPRSAHPLTRIKLQFQLSRLLTTERKQYIKEQVWTAARFTGYAWTAVALLTIIVFGIENERLERKFPSPREWSWVSRWLYRSTRGQELPEASPNGLIDWAQTGQDYKRLLQRLEDQNTDGKGLQVPLGSEGDIFVEGIGRTGFDVTTKSEPWRRGYYECLMGAARASEHLDTWVRDKTRDIAFPPEVMIGPSNPRPKPVPYGAKTAPLEENCEPAFEPPQVYYMKILTSYGFNTRQRLDAALAYADWLEFKGLPSSAEDMYDWGLDIAMGALPVGVNNVVDTNTGIIHEQASHVTPNILLATTALATHHAQNNALPTALPIFLSILRAQRNLPLLPKAPSLPQSAHPDPSAISLFASFVKSLLIAPSYPEAPPSGDAPACRTPASLCEEAATMAHIGEIMFASSSVPSSVPVIPSSAPSARLARTKATPAQSSGLAWTRSSVALAEEALLSISSVPSSSPHQPPSRGSLSSSSSTNTSSSTTTARQRCTECLLSSMANWKLMVATLKAQESAKNAAASMPPRPTNGWFWSGSSEDEEGEDKWEREAKMVEAKSREIESLIRSEGWTSGHGAGSGVLGFA
ncbi:hypothetical protein MMC19_006049 [Ptychographa xylographoides]|nr:hypothetical protein [Ptychographa xylographoides]